MPYSLDTLDGAASYCSDGGGAPVAFTVPPGASFRIGAAWPGNIMSNAWCAAGAASYVSLTLLSADLSVLSGVTTAVNAGFDQRAAGAIGCFGDQSNWTNTGAATVSVVVQQRCMFSLRPSGRCEGMIATQAVPASPPPPSPPQAPQELVNCYTNFCCAPSQSASTCRVLADLYHDAGGGAWTGTSNWDAAASSVAVDYCTLEGVACNGAGDVAALTLRGFGLAGDLSGGAMTNGLDALPALATLDLGQNGMAAAPDPLPPNLASLALDGNSLSGSLPSSLASVTGLTALALSNNALTGTLPAWVGSLSALRVLRLDGNVLTGPLPASLASLASLQELVLDGNPLARPLPDLTPLTALQLLSMSGAAGLAGEPLPLLSAPSLASLNLAGARFAGTVPASYGRLSSLTALDLHGNALLGALPSLASLTALQFLDMSDNQLSGALPDVPSFMAVANMSVNDFAGQLPASWEQPCDGGGVTIFPQQPIAAGMALQGLTKAVSDAQSLDLALAGACVTSVVLGSDISMDATGMLVHQMMVISSACPSLDGRCALAAPFASRHFALTASYLMLDSVVLTDGAPAAGQEPGGAVWLDSASELVLSNALLRDNTASDGGAVYSDGARVTVLASQLLANEAALGSGGAIAIGWPQGLLSPPLLNVSGSIFSGNAAAAAGGALAGAALALQGCMFSDNSAALGGGAVAAPSGVTLRMADCVFDGNDSPAAGGAVWVPASASAAALTAASNVTFANNAAQQGGALALFGGALALDGCVLSGNAADASGGDGGGLFTVNVSAVVIADTAFVGNAAARGGAWSALCSGLDAACASLAYTLSGSVLRGNAALSGDGGAVLLAGDGGASLNVTDAVVAGNTAAAAGGGLAGDALGLRNVTLLDNVAAGGGGGGAVFAAGPVGVAAAACTFGNNTAMSDDGGAVSAEGDGVATVLLFDGCSFVGNRALSGGALAAAGAGSSMTDCAFTGNAADADAGSGGAVWLADSLDASFVGVTFARNTAAGGGALALTRTGSACAGVTSVQASAFALNAASSRGGALALNGCTLAVADTTFANHSAVGVSATGGALYADDTSGAPLAMSLSRVTIEGASVALTPPPAALGMRYAVTVGQGSGGGLFMLASRGCATLTVADSAVVGAQVAASGAGLSVGGCVSVTMTASRVANCTAVADGGGLLLMGSISATLSQVTFAGNAAVTGAALSLASGTDTSLSNCTFADNEATHGAIMALHGDSPPPGVAMSALLATNNKAEGIGAFSFSDAMVPFKPPQCADCVTDSNSPPGPMFVSGPRTFNASASAVNATSGAKLLPLSIQLWDVFGQLVQAWPASVSIKCNDPVALSGTTTVAYADGAATFSNIMLFGLVGSNFTLTYALAGGLELLSSAAAAPPNAAASGASADLLATIMPCGNLQVFLEDSLTCGCMPGSFLNADTGACVMCFPGSVAPLPRTTSCSICAPGSYNNDDFTACIQCAAGSFLNSGSLSCDPCPAGSYAPSAGATACTANPAGFASKLESAFASALTLSGVSSSRVGAAQQELLKATLADTLGLDAGVVTIVGVAAATETRRRLSVVLASTVSFSAVTESADDTARVRASFGHLPALGGSLQAALQASDDLVFASVTGVGVAEPEETVVVLAAVPCSAGTFLDGATQSCVTCPVGLVTTSDAATACKACPANYAWVNASTCVACPENSRTSASDPARCICVGGFYDTLFGASLAAPECAVCPVGGVCDGTGFVTAKEDFWRESLLSDKFFRCRVGNCLPEDVNLLPYNSLVAHNASSSTALANASAVVRLMHARLAPSLSVPANSSSDGDYTTKTSDVGNVNVSFDPTNCVYGRVGPLCELCLPGYAVVNDQCEPCAPEDSWDAWSPVTQFVLLFFTIVGAVAFCAVAFFQPLVPRLESGVSTATTAALTFMRTAISRLEKAAASLLFGCLRFCHRAPAAAPAKGAAKVGSSRCWHLRRARQVSIPKTPLTESTAVSDSAATALAAHGETAHVHDDVPSVAAEEGHAESGAAPYSPASPPIAGHDAPAHVAAVEDAAGEFEGTQDEGSALESPIARNYADTGEEEGAAVDAIARTAVNGNATGAAEQDEVSVDGATPECRTRGEAVFSTLLQQRDEAAPGHAQATALPVLPPAGLLRVGVPPPLAPPPTRAAVKQSAPAVAPVQPGVGADAPPATQPAAPAAGGASDLQQAHATADSLRVKNEVAFAAGLFSLLSAEEEEEQELVSETDSSFDAEGGENDEEEEEDEVSWFMGVQEELGMMFEKLKRVSKILVNFYQISATFVRSLDVPWPHAFSQLCSRIGVININILALPKSACLHPEPSFYAEFMGYTFSFMFALIFIGFLWMLGKVVARWTLQSMSEEEREMRLAKFDNTLLSRVLLFLYLVYPGVSVTVISMFSCSQVGSKEFLNADFRIACWDKKHKTFVGAAVIWTMIIPFGVPRFFLWLLTKFKVPQMARLKVDNAWLCAAAKEAWARGMPQATDTLPRYITVQTISTPHLEALYALFVKGASPWEAGDIMCGASRPVAENETLVYEPEAGDAAHGHAATPASSPFASDPAARLSLLSSGQSRNLSRRILVKPAPPTRLQRLVLAYKSTRVRVSAWLHPAGKNAARLIKAPSAGAARRAFLLDVLLKHCKHSGELAIPVVDWEEREAAEEDAAVMLEDEDDPASGGGSAATTPRTPSRARPSVIASVADAEFEIKRYGLRVADLPKLQRRALRQCGFLFADYHVSCYYWEVVELLRKLMLTSILALVLPGSAGQVVVGMLIAFLALLLNLQLRPFAEETLNFMNQAAQLNMFTFLLVALLLKVNIDGDQSASYFTFIVGTLTVFPVVLPIAIRLYVRLGGFGSGAKDMKRVWADAKG